MKNNNIYKLIFLIIIVFLIGCFCYLPIYYPNTDLDQLLFAASYGLSNSDFTPFYDAFFRLLPIFISLFIVFYVLLFKSKLKDYFKKCSIVLIIFTILFGLYSFDLFSYIYYKFSSSDFIEKNYVNPKDVEISFPEKKNLIMIVLESFESTIADSDNGGSFKYNLIPEISKLNKEKDVTYFKTSDNKYGMKMIDGATYTTASLITNTSGVPFKYYTSSHIRENKFLNGSYTLGDLLYDNGYNNELISAADTNFGEVNNFFTTHGKYNIIDINSYKHNNLTISDNDLIDWGFNDNYLYETAKKRLNILTKKSEPFNLTLVGIDTHFPKGYLTNYTINKYNNQYENVYATEDILVTDFINWIKNQDYYKDTVIVVLGDHLSMEYNFFKDININNRYVYISYINGIDENNDNVRFYSALDTYPTVLGAMGATIEGNQLGLGVNMYSNKKTLMEKYGFNKLNNELKKKSTFYEKEIYKK